MRGETHSTILYDASIDTQPQTSIESTLDGFRLIINEGTARYEVQEELLGIGFPTDAVGSTQSLTGVIEVGTNGTIVSDGSMIEVDLRTLRSDEERRDGYLQRNTLQTDEYPFATLIPRQILGHTGPLPISGRVTFDLIGDLTIRGITQEIFWQFVTDVEHDSVSGEARTEFSFGDFSLTRPKVRRVLSVEDRIRLVINFSALLERQ
jgi:polyisoprenoid-binding protein YceI